jgi:hypothetical protein
VLGLSSTEGFCTSNCFYAYRTDDAKFLELSSIFFYLAKTWHVLSLLMEAAAPTYGGYLRICGISSRGKQTRAG